MTKLPNPERLAALVSNVTQTMCGISFGIAQPSDPGVACWRIASLTITGAHPLHVALFSDERGCTALGSALFDCAPEALDSSMINDSLCELLNMAAGQIKGALALDLSLGLPRIITVADLSPRAQASLYDGVLLRSRDAVNLMIAISDGHE
jgi:Chemotaxis phosphatase CheX